MEETRIKYKEYNRGNVDNAKKMRSNPTKAEEKMRKEILQYRPWWYKFLRQKPIWPFVVDFYCSKLSLAIELDWEIHKKTKDYDSQRSNFLTDYWISVIRYRNDEVMKNIDVVYKDLMEFIKEIEKSL